MRYYFEMFGYYFSLNKKQCKDYLLNGSNGNNDLSSYKEIKKEPYYTKNIYSPINWTKEDFIYYHDQLFK
jgi:hypothetical protein